MKQYAWATDIHLDHLADRSLDSVKRESMLYDLVFDFFTRISNEQIDGLFLTGDLSTGVDLLKHLGVMEYAFKRPIYFVLGNHDYWMASTSDIRKKLAEVTQLSPNVRYMGALDFVPLTLTTALVGHDGWYDALNGNYRASSFYLNDWNYILDFVNARDIDSIVSISRSLAAGGVAHVKRGIDLAIAAGHKIIVVLTHFPPFKAAHMYRGRPGDADAVPWYTSRLMGEMLLAEAVNNPSVRFHVFAGHTHGKAKARVASNMTVEVGEAKYGEPMLQRLVNVV